MIRIQKQRYLRIFFIIISLFVLFLPLAQADIYINVMAVNATDDVKDTSVLFNLPGDLTSTDILDTNGLELDYNVNDANYFVHSKLLLQPKESKTFRVRVRDIWKLSPEKIEEIKKEIEQGYEQLGQKDPDQGKALKDNLVQKLDLLQEKSTKADTVEKRMDAYRTYSKELKRIQNNALAVDYWRSDPSEVKKEKIIRFNIELENQTDKPKDFKNKHYLPSEVKPEDLVEFESFEVRFDQERKAPFLFKEEQLQPQEKKKYSIGIRDVWFVPQKDTDYLNKRTIEAYDFLKGSKYEPTAKILFDNIGSLLKSLEESQAKKKENILEHISVFRDNQKLYETARIQVESLEKLLSIYREDLSKSQVENVLQKVKSLEGVSGVSKAIFDKTKVSESDSWKFIFWILVFVGVLTIISFIVWSLRSKDKNIASQDKTDSAAVDSQEPVNQVKK